MNKAAQQLGKLGGDATKKKQPPDYYRIIGRKGAHKRWRKRRLDNNA